MHFVLVCCRFVLITLSKTPGHATHDDTKCCNTSEDPWSMWPPMPPHNWPTKSALLDGRRKLNSLTRGWFIRLAPFSDVSANCGGWTSMVWHNLGSYYSHLKRHTIAIFTLDLLLVELVTSFSLSVQLLVSWYRCPGSSCPALPLAEQRISDSRGTSCLYSHF